MENKQSTPILLGTLATILGIAVFKEFDFENLKFKKLGLGIIYLIAFGASIYFIIKSKKD